MIRKSIVDATSAPRPYSDAQLPARCILAQPFLLSPVSTAALVASLIQVARTLDIPTPPQAVLSPGDTPSDPTEEMEGRGALELSLDATSNAPAGPSASNSSDYVCVRVCARLKECHPLPLTCLQPDEKNIADGQPINGATHTPVI